MKFSPVFMRLVVLTLFMIFSAGCMSSDNGPPYPLYGKSLDQLCKGDSVNSSKWIVIEPISDKKVGEKITVTAKTNLSSGTWVSARTWPYSYNPVNRTDASGSSGISGGADTIVKEGNAGVNTIAFVADSKNFRPEPYIIIFFNDSEHVSACTWFNVSIAPEENLTLSPSRSLNESGIIMNRNSSGFWLAVDPIPHHYLEDVITFNGTTNLPAGGIIIPKIHTTAFMPCPKWSCCCSVVPCCEGINNTVIILPGTSGFNTWSWEVNSSQHGFRADGEYIISASGRNGAVDNSSIFTVSGIPKSNLTLNLPASDPDGIALRFSGQANTGNGPEEILLLTFSSDSDKKVSSTVPVFQNGTGYSWNFSLKKSEIVPYNFLTVNVSSQMSPDIRIKRTFLHNNEPVYYPYNPSGP